MSCGPITKACRVFLSRNHLYSGNVSRAMMDATLRTARGPHRRLQLQGRNWRSLLEGGNAHNDAYLEYYLGSGDLLLKVKRKRFWYREHRNGLADLIIFDRRVPDVLCLGLQPDRHRLTQIMDHDFDPFYLKSDPPVRRMRNSLRSGQQCLILTLVPTWDDANWDYSDGRNGWLE